MRNIRSVYASAVVKALLVFVFVLFPVIWLVTIA